MGVCWQAGRIKTREVRSAGWVGVQTGRGCRQECRREQRRRRGRGSRQCSGPGPVNVASVAGEAGRKLEGSWQETSVKHWVGAMQDVGFRDGAL